MKNNKPSSKSYEVQNLKTLLKRIDPQKKSDFNDHGVKTFVKIS